MRESDVQGFQTPSNPNQLYNPEQGNISELEKKVSDYRLYFLGISENNQDMAPVIKKALSRTSSATALQLIQVLPDVTQANFPIGKKKLPYLPLTGGLIEALYSPLSDNELEFYDQDTLLQESKDKDPNAILLAFFGQRFELLKEYNAPHVTQETIPENEGGPGYSEEFNTVYAEGSSQAIQRGLKKEVRFPKGQENNPFEICFNETYDFLNGNKGNRLTTFKKENNRWTVSYEHTFTSAPTASQL